MKAFVDAERCIGCGLCAGICEEVFSMCGDKAVAGDIVPENAKDKCEQAKDACPVDAIHTGQ